MSACRDPINPSLCPLCGQANLCAMENQTGANAGPCWCTRVDFSAELLQKLPDATRGKACICQACARQPTPSAKG